jgi:hypothetical protein
MILSVAFWIQAPAQTVTRPERKEGDTWTFHYRQGGTLSPGNYEQTETVTVTKVSADGFEISFVRIDGPRGKKKTGAGLRSLALNEYARTKPDGPLQEVRVWQFPLEVGKTWRYADSRR